LTTSLPGEYKLAPGDPFDPYKMILSESRLDGQLIDTTRIGFVLQEQAKASVLAPGKNLAGNIVTSPRLADRDNQIELLVGWKPLDDGDVFQAWLGAQQNSHDGPILDA
jgi:hypothetical protein